MIVKKMPILQGFPDFETVKFFTGKILPKNTILHLFFTTLKPPDYQEIPRIYT